MISLRRRVATATVAAVLATTAGTVASGGPPAGAASQSDRCYTSALHQVFLGRPASVYDLEAWIDRYAPAPARPALPRALSVSDEWLEAVVVGIYDDALDRAPDPDGLAFWIGRLRGGARVATLTAQVYGSPEVWDRAGRTAGGFVADVFPRIMGRAPSPDDVAYWAGQVPARGRGGVARALVGSIENRRDRVTDLYREILGRQPDAAGRDYWAGRLATLDDVQLAVHLASSPEAYARAQAGCAVPPAPTTTIRGSDGISSSLAPQVSGDGRWIAFLSAAPLLPGGRDDTTRDLYLLDRTTGTLTRAVEADEHVGSIAISGDGRHVAFVSRATDLVPGEGTAPIDVYSWDRTTGTVTRITDGDGTSDSELSGPSISDDGRFVAFHTSATLGPDDPVGRDTFVWDRTTGTLTRLLDGGADGSPHITPDGAHVVFSSLDTLAPGDTPDATDVFSWEPGTGAVSWVGPGMAYDVAADGDVVGSLDGGTLHLLDAQTHDITPVSAGADGFSGDPHIARDGATIAFTSWGPGLFPGDTPNSPDVFVWERATGTVARISPRGSDSASSSTSSDGRVVAFQSAPRQPDDEPAQIAVWDRGS